MKRDQRLRIVVTGLIAQHPRLGGVAWDYLQYPVGLHRLGHDVYYVEDSGEWPYRWTAGPGPDPWVAWDCSENIAHLHRTLARFGLGSRWAYRNAIAGRWHGMSDRKRSEILSSADLLINVSGTVEEPDRLQGPSLRAYIDSDPAFTQVKYLRARDGIDPADFARRVDAHDVFFSFGESLANTVPDTGHQWLPTRQPILLDEWAGTPASRDVFTTVLSWASYRPLEYGGRRYAQKDVQFWPCADLPSRVSVSLELATHGLVHDDWHSGDAARHSLVELGWGLTDAVQACGDLDSYREYIRSSAGEWSVAKHGYVAARTGWFSCRSACYLAAARPVVVEDTGFSDVLPTGSGLFAFQTPDDAAASLEAIAAAPARHHSAAADLAREYFASDRVLPALLEAATATNHALPAPAGR